MSIKFANKTHNIGTKMTNKALRSFARSLIINTSLYNMVQQWRYGKFYCQLIKSGNLNPPPYEVKQLIILLYAKLYNLEIFIETGTYLGDTVNSLKSNFKQIYSVELQPDFYQRAKEKFISYPHISIIYGDSGEVLPQILQNVDRPCLFWLDGHYSSGNTAKGSKETPIVEELQHILSHHVNGHVILIDDARNFNGYGDYPTLGQIQKIINSKFPNYFFDVRHDVIRIHDIIN